LNHKGHQEHEGVKQQKKRKKRMSNSEYRIMNVEVALAERAAVTSTFVIQYSLFDILRFLFFPPSCPSCPLWFNLLPAAEAARPGAG